MLEILDNDKKSNFSNTNFFKSLPLSFYNLHSFYKLCSIQIAQAITLDIDINERLSI